MLFIYLILCIYKIYWIINRLYFLSIYTVRLQLLLKYYLSIDVIVVTHIVMLTQKLHEHTKQILTELLAFRTDCLIDVIHSSISFLELAASTTFPCGVITL